MTQISDKHYHPLQVTLHWLVVILVFAAFVIGKSMSGQSNDAAKLTPLALHMSVGLITLVVIVFRFVVRMKLPRPAYASTGNAFLDWVGKIVHHALYALVFLMAAGAVRQNFLNQ